MPCPAQTAATRPHSSRARSGCRPSGQVRSELVNIDNAGNVGAVAGREQLRSVLTNETK